MRWLVLRPLPSLSPHRPPAACSPTTSSARSGACRAGIVAADSLSLGQASRSWTSVLHQSRRTAASSQTARGQQPRPVLAGAAHNHNRRASSVRIDWSERRCFELAYHIVISKGSMTRFSRARPVPQDVGGGARMPLGRCRGRPPARTLLACLCCGLCALAARNAPAGSTWPHPLLPRPWREPPNRSRSLRASCSALRSCAEASVPSALAAQLPPNSPRNRTFALLANYRGLPVTPLARGTRVTTHPPTDPTRALPIQVGAGCQRRAATSLRFPLSLSHGQSGPGAATADSCN